MVETEKSRELLLRFPKQRPPLPEPYRAIYVEHYRENRGGGSAASYLAKKMESWMHRKVAGDISEPSAEPHTLEIGAGNLNHLDYEPARGKYDIVEPFEQLYANSPALARVASIYDDLAGVGNERFDRIISIATFEHLCDLPSVVARCGLLLKPGGKLRVAIPSEGALLWKLGWKLTTAIEFRLRHHLDYGVLMSHEHVNTAEEIFGVLQIFFNVVRRSVFGISPWLSFYQFFECADPDTARCTRYMGRRFTSLNIMPT